MTAPERAKRLIEDHAIGIDRNTLGFDAWQFKEWLTAAIVAAEDAARLSERERCARIADGYANGCEAAAAIRHQ